MAVITSTVSNVSLSSRYTCTHYRDTFDSSYDPNENYINNSYDASYPNEDSITITFSYTIPAGETVNIAILSLTSVSNTFGGSLKINDEEVYKTSGKYIVYLNPSDLGTSSTTFTLKFRSYNPTHSHSSNYDSHTSMVDSRTEGIYEYHTFKKSHTGTLNLSNITLNIYTGDDSADVPSTPLITIGVNDVARKVSDIYVGVNGVARKVSDAWVGINGVARKIWPCLELKDVPVGSLIQLTEDQDGNLALYRVMGHNHYDTGSTVLMRETLLTAGRHSSNTGNNDDYFGQAMDTYLNSTWRATLHGPLILALRSTNINAQPWYAGDGSSRLRTQARYIWAPSLNEIGAYESSSVSYQNEGSRFAYFNTHSDATYLKAKDASGTARGWWTRSPVFGTTTAKAVNASDLGDPISNYEVGRGAIYYRPVFCISNKIPVAPINATTYDLIL